MVKNLVLLILLFSFYFISLWEQLCYKIKLLPGMPACSWLPFVGNSVFPGILRCELRSEPDERTDGSWRDRRHQPWYRASRPGLSRLRRPSRVRWFSACCWCETRWSWFGRRSLRGLDRGLGREGGSRRSRSAGRPNKNKKRVNLRFS